jgi:hypothetical protein
MIYKKNLPQPVKSERHDKNPNRHEITIKAVAECSIQSVQHSESSQHSESLQFSEIIKSKLKINYIKTTAK